MFNRKKPTICKNVAVFNGGILVWILPVCNCHKSTFVGEYVLKVEEIINIICIAYQDRHSIEQQTRSYFWYILNSDEDHWMDNSKSRLKLS